MTTALWLRDLGSFALQLAVIIAAGAAIWRLLRVRQSGVSLAYWRLLLLACLLLPLCQPWRAPARPSIEASMRAPGAPAIRLDRERAAPFPFPSGGQRPVSDVVLAILGAGVAARSLWLVAGAFSLRRLRRTAVRLEPLPAAVLDAQARIGAHADVYVSDRIAGPITFGLRRPVVIVPPSVLAMDRALQDAIVTHELLHVRRRDWLHVILEEVIRTAFWFHPAIWWLIGRIQLSREHVVDEAVIRLTQSRDRYIEALLAVARTSSPAPVVPAPRFLRRRFLKRRVAHILQEATMTTRRLIASVTVSAAALGLAAVLAVRAFPLEARTPPPAAGQVSSTAPIQIVAGGDHLLHGSLPEYPRRAIEQRIEGDVVLDLTVDERGEVSDARVVSGPDQLRRAALASVLQWHYAPETLSGASTQVALRFRVPPPGTEPGEPGPRWEAYAIEREAKSEPGAREPSPAQRTERQLLETELAMRDPAATDRQKEEYKRKVAEFRERLEHIRAGGGEDKPAPVFAGTARLAQIRTERVPAEIVETIRERAGINIGDAFTEATAKRVHEIVATLDEHLRVRFEGDGKGGVVMMIVAP